MKTSYLHHLDYYDQIKQHITPPMMIEWLIDDEHGCDVVGSDTAPKSLHAARVLLDQSPFNDAACQFVLFHLQRTLNCEGGAYGPLLSETDCATLSLLLQSDGPCYVLQRDDLRVRYGRCV